MEALYPSAGRDVSAGDPLLGTIADMQTTRTIQPAGSPALSGTPAPCGPSGMPVALTARSGSALDRSKPERAA
jgi:hypothetical protein